MYLRWTILLRFDRHPPHKNSSHLVVPGPICMIYISMDSLHKISENGPVLRWTFCTTQATSYGEGQITQKAILMLLSFFWMCHSLFCVLLLFWGIALFACHYLFCVFCVLLSFLHIWNIYWMSNIYIYWTGSVLWQVHQHSFPQMQEVAAKVAASGLSVYCATM